MSVARQTPQVNPPKAQGLAQWLDTQIERARRRPQFPKFQVIKSNLPHRHTERRDPTTRDEELAAMEEDYACVVDALQAVKAKWQERDG